MSGQEPRSARQYSPYANSSSRSSNAPARTYSAPPLYPQEEEDFNYPEEIDDPSLDDPEPAYARRRPLDLPPSVEPSTRTRRPRARGSRPMPKRLSEELEETFEEEPIAPAEPAPTKTRRRSAKSSASLSDGEQIEMKLKTPPKKTDVNVKKRQSLGVILVVMAAFILLAIVSYTALDASQAETKIADLPAIFLRSDPAVNASADTVHNWVGLIGSMLANFFINKTIGYAAIIFPFFMGWWSLALFRFSAKQRRRLTLATSFMLISAILFSATIGTTQLIQALPHLDREWSGAVGQFLGLTFTRLIGSIGALTIYATSFVVMLVFAIDLDIELTFRRLQDGYMGLTAKTRLRLIEFWDRRQAKRAQKREYDEDLDEPMGEDVELDYEPESEPIVAAKPAKVIKRTAETPARTEAEHEVTIKRAPRKQDIAKNVIVAPEPIYDVDESEPDNSTVPTNDNPARDIITIRHNTPATGKATDTTFLKTRPAPKDGIPSQRPAPNRVTRSEDNLLGQKAIAMSRLSNGGTSIPAHKSVRILPSDITDIPVETPTTPAPITPRLSSSEAANTPQTDAQRIDEPTTLEPRNSTTAPPPPIGIGDAKVLANEILPHSRTDDGTSDKRIDANVSPKKASATLFGVLGNDIIAENPYNEHLSKYRHPSFDLLTPTDPSENEEADAEELEKKGTILRDKLAQFGVEIENIVVTPGPVVTLYEFTPADGVKVSTVGNLTDDIALAMKARGIRIIAPMPGRGTIGIEIPNDKPKTVHMRSLLDSTAFINSKMNLPVALGKTISGDVYIDDLSKMPHLLIAGATGSGKSVGVNGILTSLLYAKSPRDIKFVIVDPKKIELSLYKALKDHFLIVSPEVGEEIVTTPAYAVIALQACVIEMERRYDKLAKAAVRSLADYNLKVSQGKLKSTQNEQHYHLPYIVVIIDELADLMITAGRDIEEPICRLAQMARAVGIHLILATQRPSVDVITGVIKANFPARIAYQVATKVDSRTILDSMGAEQLLGNGDMLYLPSGTPKPIRLQAPYISTEEVEAIVEAIGSQQGPGYSYSHPWRLPSVKSKSSSAAGGEDADVDSMFEEAARCVVQHGQASTSMLQRRLKIGYSRAARIIDELERNGIVGPADGAKAREVLVETDAVLDVFLEGLV